MSEDKSVIEIRPTIFNVKVEKNNFLVHMYPVQNAIWWESHSQNSRLSMRPFVLLSNQYMKSKRKCDGNTKAD